MMEIGKVHHMGYLVKDALQSITVFKALGYQIEKDIYFDSERLAKLCFMVKEETRIELVVPNKDSDIYSLIKTYSNAIYHVCYEVKDIDKAINELKEQGYLLFREKQRAEAISENAIVAFMMHIRMGIIELVQYKEGE